MKENIIREININLNNEKELYFLNFINKFQKLKNIILN